MIKEFKNGNLNVKGDRVFSTGDEIYNHELTMSDYYIEQIDGYLYLVNVRIERVYDLSSIGYNIKEIMNSFEKGIKLIPFGKRDSKRFIKDCILNDYQY